MDKHPLNRAGWARSGASVALLSLAAGQAAALGLGRIAAQSALGEPLRAEIEVTSLSPEEAAGLQVRIAGPDAYRAAGVDYNPILSSARAALQRRPDGRTVLRLLSDRVVQEPFVELILDVAWPSGRLVREYTLLIDPPGQRAAALGSAVEGQPAVAPSLSGQPPLRLPPTPGTVLPRPPVPARAAATPMGQPVIEAEGSERQGRLPARAPAAPSDASEVDRYRVRPGDTLAGIAGRVRRPGVSLDQMLASLYRQNASAFIGSNIHRLRSGALLTVPSTAEVRATRPEQARQTIEAQSADFGAYRRGLAGAAVEGRTESASRQSSGTLQAAVEDRKAAANTSPDRLTLSKEASTLATVNDTLASLQRERRDAEARLSSLQRSIDELRALSGQSGAPAAAASRPAPVLAIPGAAPPPPAAVAPRVPPAAAADPLVLAPSSPGAVAVPSVPEPAGAVMASPAASLPAMPSIVPSAPPVRRPVPAPLPAEPPPSPGVLGGLLDENSLLLPLLGLLLSMLLIGGVIRHRRLRGAVSAETSFLDSKLKGDSFFAASGGQQVDTRQPGGGNVSTGYSLSQLDAGGDVDPVAEADVYLAYGRDLQAEEILKDAMRSDPQRLAIRTKLLEVYAKRRDTRGFEVLASQLHTLTDGRGEDWEKAQELGLTLEPTNPLYSAGGSPDRGDGEDESDEPLGVHTLPQVAYLSGEATSAGRDDDTGVDIDLGFDSDATVAGALGELPPLAFDSAPSATESTEVVPVMVVAPAAARTPAPAPAIALEKTAPAAAAVPTAGSASTPRAAAPALPDLEVLDFDVPDLPTLAPASSPQPAAVSAPQSTNLDFPMEFDLSGISLDLDLPSSAAAPAAPALPVASLASDNDAIDFFDLSDAADPLQHKFELAEELLQLGDEEGARDLLSEVVAAADGPLKLKAEGVLKQIP